VREHRDRPFIVRIEYFVHGSDDAITKHTNGFGSLDIHARWSAKPFLHVHGILFTQCARFLPFPATEINFAQAHMRRYIHTVADRDLTCIPRATQRA